MKLFIQITIILLFFFSCKSRQSSVNTMESMQEETGVINPIHNSQNSLDWVGSYSGILPCTDCMGIQTMIVLFDDKTFESSSIYLGKSNKLLTENGTFTWQEEGKSIAICDNDGEMTVYKVEENQLRMLDSENREVIGDLAKNYILQKASSPITNKYWKATEIMGEEVAMNENMNREPHLIIRANGEFSGGGGCNSIFGKFNLEGKNGITFSSIAMSEMECMYENFDQGLLEALNSSRQFIMIDEEHMQLIVGKRAPLAKFKVVYF